MKRGSKGWESTMQAIRRALGEYGFFQVTYDEIEPKYNDDLLHTMEQLFDLDLETKGLFTADVQFDGYYHREDPLLEAMAISDALALRNIETFARLLLPTGNGNAQICDTIHLYATKLWKLEKAVRRMVFESFGVEHYFEEQESSMQYTLRLMKYKAGTTEESRGTELLPHYDKSFLTILHEYGAGGLQVKAGDWIQPKLSGSSFLVLAGESFLGWSNGRLKCALHRVKMIGDEHEAIRYSVGLFSTQKGTVKIPSEVVDEEYPLQFKPFDRAGLLEVYVRGMATAQDCNGNGDHIVPTIKQHYAI